MTFYGTERAVDDLNQKATIYKMQTWLSEERCQLQSKPRGVREKERTFGPDMITDKKRIRWSSKCSFCRMGPTTHPGHTGQQFNRHSSEVSKSITKCHSSEWVKGCSWTECPNWAHSTSSPGAEPGPQPNTDSSIVLFAKKKPKTKTNKTQNKKKFSRRWRDRSAPLRQD